MWATVRAVGSSAGSTVPDAAAQAFDMDLQIGDLCIPTEKSRDEPVEKQIAMEGYRGNQTLWRQDEQAGVSVFRIALSRGTWSRFMWCSPPLPPALCLRAPAVTLADFPHISSCDIVTFLLATELSAPAQGRCRSSSSSTFPWCGCWWWCDGLSLHISTCWAAI